MKKLDASDKITFRHAKIEKDKVPVINHMSSKNTMAMQRSNYMIVNQKLDELSVPLATK